MIIPTGDRLLVRKRMTLARFADSKQRLLLADTIAAKIAPTQGRVLATGARAQRVKDGDTVVFGMGVGFEVNATDVIISEKDVICLLGEAGKQVVDTALTGSAVLSSGQPDEQSSQEAR